MPGLTTTPGSSLALSCFAAVVALGLVAGVSAETWRGLTVAPEHRCAPYDKRRDYSNPHQSSATIVRKFGTVCGRYTGTCFESTAETDIEHIVAASEAHDSGLCARNAAPKARFARDTRNLTLASPRVNRHEKSGKDAAEWVPTRNRCWFAARVVVRFSERPRPRERWRRRSARSLRRQPKRQDHLQGGPPARDRPGAAFASSVPVHEGCGRGWGVVCE